MMVFKMKMVRNLRINVWKYRCSHIFILLGIKPVIELLDRYGGWPAVKGSSWNEENWNWVDTSQQICRDGLLKLILNWGIGVDLKNSTRNVLIVRFQNFKQNSEN